MTHINLLPWREALKKDRQNQFLTALGLAAALAALGWGGVHMEFQRRIDYQDARNNFLTGEIEKVDKQIKEIENLEKKKKQLIARMESIQKLQQGRPQIVHVFDELARTLPDGVFLMTVKQTDQSLTVEGFGQSNARISSYMRNLDASDWMADPKLSFIESQKGAAEPVSNKTAKFLLNVNLSNPLKIETGEGTTP